MAYPDVVRLADVLRRQVEQQTRCPRVALMIPSTVGFVGTYFGILWARRVAVPLNFLLQPAELAAIIADAGVDMVIGIRFFEKSLACLPARVVYLEDLPLKREMLFARVRPVGRAPDVGADETAVILYTSGTSGAPKGVCLSYDNLRSNADDCITHARLEPGHRFLGVLPLFHSFGLTAMLHAPVVTGAAVHYLPRFSPAGLIAAIREQRSSVLMAIASMYAGMLRAKEGGAGDLASLIYPISGGEALSMQVFEQFQQRFGLQILQGYGMTETSPVVSINVPWSHRVGSVGRAIPRVTVAAHDDAGGALSADRIGELWVRGPCVMQGYFNKPEETARVKTADGWLKTGDMGRVDAEGFITITGRKKEMIIVGGENVYPREIEAVLEGHAAVAEVAVIGQQDASRGESIVAFVTCKEGQQVKEIELRDYCRERLAGYKVPRRIVIRADLPRGPTGKILKRSLHALLAGE